MRLVAMPALKRTFFDALKKALEQAGSVGIAASDDDLDATFASVLLDAPVDKALKAAARALEGAARGALVQIQRSLEALDDAAQQAATTLGSAQVARRDRPLREWRAAHPIGADATASIWVEAGAPTLLVKAAFWNVPERAAEELADAVAGETSGFADVALMTSGNGCLLLEVGDTVRTPLHRVLDVLDIEARRFGGTLGTCTLLSHVDLDALLGSLGHRLSATIARRQIVETHVPETST